MTRHALAVALALLVVPGPPGARAATDDLLVITGDRVNVRAGPGKDEKLVGKLARGQVVVELERSGEWLRIDMGGGRDVGWVHESLIQALPDDGVAVGPGSVAFQAFRQDLDRQSRRVLAATGSYPFMVAEDLGDGMVVITPSEDWLIGGGDLTDDAWSLYRLWKSHNDGRPVTLAITNERGSIYITVQDTATEPLLTVHH